MPEPKPLFGVPANQIEEHIKWGIGPGEHVAHIYTKDQPNMVEIPFNSLDDITQESGYQPVTDRERFDNSADNKTADFFYSMAKDIATTYEKIDGRGETGKEYKKLLEQMKNYLTAGSRSGQQAELKKLKEMRKHFDQTLKTDQELDEQQLLTDSHDILDAKKWRTRKDTVDDYFKKIDEFNNGTLEYQRDKNAPKPAEPSNTKSGAIGMWVKTDEALFPHEPSPNDIKQGYGVENCYMLSVLASKAAKDPQFIKDMMKDNGDGTVTVRFYDTDKKPVYIDVQKTVNKGPVGNNVYSSGALWVQMLEKAYAQYATDPDSKKHFRASEVGSKKQGFAAIDRGNSAAFLNAIEPEQKFETRVNITPMIDRNHTLYDFDEKGNEFPPIDRSEGYLQYEENLYDFMSSITTQHDETLTVGTTPYTGSESYKNQFLKNRGIRTGHAYSVMKVFEKKVNGQTKKFVQLRDPYATFKAEYNNKGELVENSYGGALAGGATMLSGIANAGTEGMGTFNLEFTDFLKCFKTFTGISTERTSELSTLVAKMKIVDGKPQYENGKPVFEHDYRQEFAEEIEAKRRPFTKEEETKALEGLTDDQRELYEKISNPDTFKEIAKNMKECASDLRCTDDFFTAPNSKQFNKMRDATYSLNKMMSKVDNAKDLTLKERMYFVNKLGEVGEMAKTYNQKKIKDMQTMQAKGKMPSERFAYRLGTSLNIINVAKGNKPVANTNSKTGTGLGIMIQDINTKIDLVNNGEANLTDANELQRMQDMVEVIDKVCQNSEKIQKDAHISKDDIKNTKEKIQKVDNKEVGFDFEDLSADEVVEKAPKKEEPEKKNTLDFADDFTIVENMGGEFKQVEQPKKEQPKVEQPKKNDVKKEAKATEQPKSSDKQTKREEKKTTKTMGGLRK